MLEKWRSTSVSRDPYTTWPIYYMGPGFDPQPYTEEWQCNPGTWEVEAERPGDSRPGGWRSDSVAKSPWVLFQKTKVQLQAPNRGSNGL